MLGVTQESRETDEVGERVSRETGWSTVLQQGERMGHQGIGGQRHFPGGCRDPGASGLGPLGLSSDAPEYPAQGLAPTWWVNEGAQCASCRNFQSELWTPSDVLRCPSLLCCPAAVCP